MALGNIIRNIRDRGLKDVTSKKKIKTVLDFEEIKRNGLTLTREEIISFSEQIVYRTLQCEDCVLLGECRVCHCPIKDLMSTPSATCEDKKWLAIMPPDEWETYKKQMGIKFNLQ